MGINFVLPHYIPQDSHQIWDEAPKTRMYFSILRNTCIRLFTFTLVHNHASLPGLKSRGDVFKHKRRPIFRSPSKLVSGFQSFHLASKKSTLSWVCPEWVEKSVRNFIWISRLSSILASIRTVSTILFFNRNT